MLTKLLLLPVLILFGHFPGKHNQLTHGHKDKFTLAAKGKSIATGTNRPMEGRSRGSEDSVQLGRMDATRARVEDERIAKKRAAALAAIPTDEDIKRQVDAQAKRLNMPDSIKERSLKSRLDKAKKARTAVKAIK